MNLHPQFDEDLDLYALNMLEEERGALETHLRRCAECTRKLQQARARLALIALDTPPQVPPAGARDRLLARVRQAELMRSRPLPEKGVFRPSLWSWARWAPVLALSSALLAGISGWLVVQNSRMAGRMDALRAENRELAADRSEERAGAARARKVLDVMTAGDTTQVVLMAGRPRPAPQGKAFYNRGKGLVFYASNLPQLPTGKTYQLWLVPSAGQPISAGTFNTDTRGDGEVVLPALPSGVAAKAFAVTVEPAGGVPQPTGPKVLIGAA